MSGEHVLFLFAHQDDEVGVAPRIVREIAAGRVVHCAYLTNGEAKGVSEATRCAESSRVLRALGEGKIDVAFLGNSVGVADGALTANLDSMLEALIGWVVNWQGQLSRLYLLAWEGGHHDHDAVHALGLALSRHFAVTDVWQFPLYNGHRTRGRFFRVMHALPMWNAPDVTRLSFAEGLRYAWLCSQYPSQWRTWLGLFPGVFREYVIRRRHAIYPADAVAGLSPPHAGTLLYERMYGVDSARIYAQLEPLRRMG